MRRLPGIILLLIAPFILKAQPCSGPGRTPSTAIPVCGSLIFSQPLVGSCTGNYIDISSSGCFSFQANNCVWYKFHCYQTGTLGMLITPGSSLDDYDWAVMDITNLSPDDVFSSDLFITLNMSGQPGPTGCTATGNSNIHCEGGAAGSQYNAMPTLQAGHDYLVAISNYSNSGTGYSITFSGTALLNDNNPPAIRNISIAGCDPSKIKVTFTKDVLCSSITATGSEFSITNGTHVISGVVSQCSTGATTDTSVIINLQTPLAGGNYNLVIGNGTDGNTFQDVCQLQTPAGTSVPFTVPAQPVLDITGISFSGCAPNVLDIALSKPVLCSSISATGSEFSITPGTAAVLSAQTTCTGSPAYTTHILLTLQNQLPHGSYQLIVNNGTDGNTILDTCGIAMSNAYSFPVVIPQTTVAPVVQSIIFDECHPDKLIINFDKPVLCASLSAMGSEFTVTPGTHPVQSVSSACGANTYTTQVTVTLQNPLPAGNFNLLINNGTDANTLSDTCFAFIPTGYSKPFVSTQAPAPVFDSVQYDRCNPAFIKVFYNHPIRCASIAANGSDYSITGPSAVNITGATTNTTCANGYTNWVLLQFAQPVNSFGNYVLHNTTGSDGNGIIDTCSAAQLQTETIAFSELKPDATFTANVHWGCVTDTIFLSHPGGSGVNTWTWTFSDGTTATGQNVTHTFPVSTVSTLISLSVSNASCNDNSSQTITLNNAFNTAFDVTPIDTICRQKPVSFTNNSTGNNLQYLWQFGDGTVFNGQAAPAHNYTTAGQFIIRLVATNDHGCRDTATRNMYVTDLPAASFATLLPKYCVGDPVNLTANLQGNLSGYTWNNGDGATFSNTPTVSFTYLAEKQYTILLTAEDRFCGLVSSTASTNVYALPVVQLGPDVTVCPGLVAEIGLPANAAFSYLWNTGATTSYISTLPASARYHLAVTNQGCTGSDDIDVHVLDNCLIRVAGAFTPNGDGRNDQLKAINAELATKFRLSVYNRFGQMLFSTTDPLKGWDGRFKGQPAETGTYVWQLNYVDPVSKLAVYQKGASILIR